MGLSLTLDSQRLLGELDEDGRDDTSIPSSTSQVPIIELHKVTEIAEKRKTPFERFRIGESRSINLPPDFARDAMSAKLQKADSVVSKREAINKTRKNSSKSINRKEILDKDKSVYMSIMYPKKADLKPQDSVGISLHKRTMKYDIKDPDYEYRIRPVVYCHICKKNLPLSFIDENVPQDNEKIRLRQKVNKEKDALSVCKQCNSCRVKITLVITRCKAFISKYKRKYEKVLEIDYLGPFMLFSKLKKLQKNELNKVSSINKQMSSKSLRVSGLLHEINSNTCNYRLLQFDVVELFKDHKELFWNLIYRFTKDKRDYIFMLPYETDMEEPQSDDESSSVSSEGIMSQLSQKPKRPSKHDSQQALSSFAKLPKLPTTVYQKSSKFVPEEGALTDRRATGYADLVKQATDDSLISTKKRIQLESRDSRKSF